jgi:hypothetical protein
VLLAATTVDELKSPAVLRRLDLIQAKGISQPTWIYESLGHHTRGTFHKLAAVIKAYEAGVDCYQRRDWTGSLGHFAAALEMAPPGPAVTHLLRPLPLLSDQPAGRGMGRGLDHAGEIARKANIRRPCESTK